MALCNTEVKNQVKSTHQLQGFRQEVRLSGNTKGNQKIVYNVGSDNLYTKHSKAMAHINYMNL